MRFSLFIGLLAFLPGSALSATIYGVEADWLAAMSSTTAVAVPDTGGGVNSFVSGDLTFTKSGLATNLIGGPTADTWSTIIDGIDLAISSPEDFTVTFGTAVTGFAFVLHEPTAAVGVLSPFVDACNATCVDSMFNFTLYSGAVLLGSFDFLPDDDVANFVGFSSDLSFDKVVINDVTATIDNEFFGEFRTGDAVVNPLPASLPLLFFGGLVGVALATRRRGKTKS